MKKFIRELKTPELVTMGSSAGGIEALKNILSALPDDFYPAMVVVQHIGVGATQNLADFFKFLPFKKIKEAEDKEDIQNGYVYFAPKGYHLMVSEHKSFGLSLEDPVCYSRPSIDVLFETAAEVYKEAALGIILTGANDDGARGLAKIAFYGGQTIVQDPTTAEYSIMPLSALKLVAHPTAVLNLKEIQTMLAEFQNSQKGGAYSTQNLTC